MYFSNSSAWIWEIFQTLYVSIYSHSGLCYLSGGPVDDQVNYVVSESI